MRTFAGVLDDAAARAAGWRAEGDLVRDGIALMREVGGAMAADPLLLEAALEAGPARPEAEAFYLRAVAHGHTWVTGGPLDEHLRALALRVPSSRGRSRASLTRGVLASAMFSEPLATVEALCRGYGLHARPRGNIPPSIAMRPHLPFAAASLLLATSCSDFVMPADASADAAPVVDGGDASATSSARRPST